MSFIIGNKCVSTCDTACVTVCPVDCIHGPIDIDGAGAEVEKLREEDKLEGLQLFINPDECIDCGACVPACPPDAIYETEDDCIDDEGDDKSVVKNYEFEDNRMFDVLGREYETYQDIPFGTIYIKNRNKYLKTR